MSDLECREDKQKGPSTHNQADSRFSGCFQVLETALMHDALKDLLLGDMGAFSVRYWFINHYTNMLILKDLKNNIIPGTGKISNNGFMHFAKSIFSRKHLERTDILFVSRNRQVEIKTPSGTVIGDYMFHSVISELRTLRPQLKISSLLIDDSYRKYEYASQKDFIKEAFRAIKLYLRWRYSEKSLEKNSKKCVAIISLAQSFFSLRILFRYGITGCSIRNYINRIKPEIIIANDDCIYTKLINTADHKLVVVQSASMLESMEKCRALTFEDQRLLPEAFVVTGLEYEKIKRHYGVAKRVVVTGQPRYDILANINKIYSRTDFLKRFGINDMNRVLLWTTQSHGLSNDENINNLNTIFSALKHIKQVSLIIKQHPDENDFHTQMILDHIEKYNAEAILMAKNSDTYEQLCACDILITRHSTTAIEAIALNKPVIILNLSGQPDPVDYVSCGVAAGVYEGDNLENVIKKLFQDDSDLRKNRAEYVKQRLYMIDGQATRRVVDLITRMMNVESDEHDN